MAWPGVSSGVDGEASRGLASESIPVVKAAGATVPEGTGTGNGGAAGVGNSSDIGFLQDANLLLLSYRPGRKKIEFRNIDRGRREERQEGGKGSGW